MLNTTAMECADRAWMNNHGYFAGGPCYDVDKPAWHDGFEYDGESLTMIVGHYDDYWFGELEDDEGCALETQTDEVHPDIAVAKTLAYHISLIAFGEEGNCEDAVNRVAYDTYFLMFRDGFKPDELWPNVKMPDVEDELAVLDMLLGIARDAVKWAARDEWEEF